MSERGGTRRRDILDERSNLERAMSQTSRIVGRVGTFFKSKYRSLIDYLWEDPNAGMRYFKPNVVMQAPPDDSMMVGQNESMIMFDVPGS